ncbi:ABC transporter permease [Nocardiopsis sp. NRRL B-16309]|uniref:ABC transporter permease n=1 Tax=Nocardiopsis sp. NRRL B-16309 TaxID=1519494 RepID=UPI000AFA57A6|nr:ABC transporter permease [Nocardiopsis sp. NRRL B-16309]
MTFAVIPLQTLGFLSVVRFAGRADLDIIAVVAPALMALWVNALYTGGEVVRKDRDDLRLEPLVSSRGSVFGYLVGRVGAVTIFSLLVFTEALLVGWLVFGVSLEISALHVVAVTLVTTAVATTATSILFSVVFVNTRNPHTYQNAMGYPFFLLGGVLVPVTLYPDWIQALCRAVYLSWSSDLFREAFGEGHADGWLWRNGVILGLAAVTLAVAAWMLMRTLDNARREGRLALT